MTTLTQLTEHYCPDGVAYVKLGELEDRGDVKLGRGKVISKTTMSENPGDHPVYSSSASANGLFGTYGDYMFDDERITWSVDGGGKLFYRPAHKYSVTNVCGWMKTTSGSVTTKYLYYALYQLWTGEVFDYTRKAHPSVIRDVYQIPLPPREVQDAIVERLDSFAALIESLDSEITLREKRFEYFREQLLNFDESDGVEYVKLEDVFELGSGYTPSRKNTQYWENGSIPWFRMDDIRTNGRILSHSLEKITPEAVKGGRLFPGNSVILSTSATIGEHAIVTTDFMCNQRFHVLVLRETFTERVHPRFVYYVGFSLGEYCREHVNEGNFKTVSSAAFKAFPFPLPPYEVQDTIIDKLDTMQALIANLKQERELRKTQFEYYREKLLTFNS